MANVEWVAQRRHKNKNAIIALEPLAIIIANWWLQEPSRRMIRQIIGRKKSREIIVLWSCRRTPRGRWSIVVILALRKTSNFMLFYCDGIITIMMMKGLELGPPRLPPLLAQHRRAIFLISKFTQVFPLNFVFTFFLLLFSLTPRREKKSFWIVYSTFSHLSASIFFSLSFATKV